jgi:hypothetical protein
MLLPGHHLLVGILKLKYLAIDELHLPALSIDYPTRQQMRS